MQVILAVLFLSGSYPLARAWRASRSTPLLWAVTWAALAWGAWALTAVATGEAPALDPGPLRYIALCLTCCSGVAVLGARQPGAAAWNAVVLGLLAVLLLPLAEQLILGNPSLGWVRLLFLAVTLAFLFFNYLPTVFAPAAFLFALAAGAEVSRLAYGTDAPVPEELSLAGLALIPWLALLAWHSQPRPPSEFDGLWRSFRNRYGLVWAVRLREQFNRAAAHAGWPVHLYWQGLHLRRGEPAPDADTREQMVRTWRAMLKRFG